MGRDGHSGSQGDDPRAVQSIGWLCFNMVETRDFEGRHTTPCVGRFFISKRSRGRATGNPACKPREQATETSPSVIIVFQCARLTRGILRQPVDRACATLDELDAPWRASLLLCQLKFQPVKTTRFRPAHIIERIDYLMRQQVTSRTDQQVSHVHCEQRNPSVNSNSIHNAREVFEILP